MNHQITVLFTTDANAFLLIAKMRNGDVFGRIVGLEREKTIVIGNNRDIGSFHYHARLSDRLIRFLATNRTAQHVFRAIHRSLIKGLLRPSYDFDEASQKDKSHTSHIIQDFSQQR